MHGSASRQVGKSASQQVGKSAQRRPGAVSRWPHSAATGWTLHLSPVFIFKPKVPLALVQPAPAALLSIAKFNAVHTRAASRSGQPCTGHQPETRLPSQDRAQDCTAAAAGQVQAFLASGAPCPFLRRPMPARPGLTPWPAALAAQAGRSGGSLHRARFPPWRWLRPATRAGA